MANIFKMSSELKITATFADGDDRTISVDNPRSELTLADIANFATKAANVLIGDKSGAAFVSFTKPHYVETEICYLDISQ